MLRQTISALALAGALACFGLVALAPAQNPPLGLTPCTANPPASLAVSNVSSNVRMGTCGATVIVYNITSQEVFWLLGAASSTAATTSANSLPGNTYVVLSVPTVSGSGYYFAAITASSTSTLRFVQGSAH